MVKRDLSWGLSLEQYVSKTTTILLNLLVYLPMWATKKLLYKLKVHLHDDKNAAFLRKASWFYEKIKKYL